MSDEDDVLTILALCDRLGITSAAVRSEMIGEPEVALAILRRVKRERGIHNPPAYATARFRGAVKRRQAEARARPSSEAGGLADVERLVAEVAPAPPRLADLELARALTPSKYRESVLRCMAAAVARFGGFEVCMPYMLGQTDEPPPYLTDD